MIGKSDETLETLFSVVTGISIILSTPYAAIHIG